MSVTVAPLPATVYTALGNFIMGVTGLAQENVVRGIDNDVPTPNPSPGFVVMTPLFQIPLATNQQNWDVTNSNPLVLSIERDTQMNVQVDCYGTSADQWAAELSTLLRSDYGCVQLAPNCQPLYAGDARMLPLDDSEDNFEQRWSFDAILQWNPVTTVTQPFADSLAPGIYNVQATYPAT